MEKDTNKLGEKVAPFNAAIACLMRIDVCLSNYSECSNKFRDDFYQEVLQRQKIAFDLIVLSSPLLQSKQIEKLLGKTKKIKFKTKPTYEGSRSKKITNLIEVRSELNEVVILCQKYLQDEGKYLMPSSKDPRFNWGMEK